MTVLTHLHFIRPYWLLSFIPWLGCAYFLFRQLPVKTAWSQVCDAHLLPYLLQQKSPIRRTLAWSFLWLSTFFFIVSIAGPTWSRFPVPVYQQVQPRVMLLDMSSSMLMNDVTPDRLTRAKFKLRDLFDKPNVGQFGLIVYTSEPFVVSPLTDDGKTIAALLSVLMPDIMPVEGQQLSPALTEGASLIRQAGLQHGQLLVLTATPPDQAAIAEAKKLAAQHIQTSIIPIMSAALPIDSAFQQLANAGGGEYIPFSDSSADIEKWLSTTRQGQEYKTSTQDDVPVWRDEGRWFLIPGLLLLLPAFRRGWLS